MIIRGIPLLAILLIGCLHVPPALSATYYISPTGSNANPGTLAKPWLTWAYAFAKSSCGDTLIVMDGAYTTTTHGAPIIAKVCTASSPYKITAQNERKAYLQSDGTNYGLRTLNAAYIILDGLRVSMDSRSGSVFSTVQFRSSNHITWRRGLVFGTNRYSNVHAVELYGTSDSLVEESEVYFFHRHAFIVEGGNRNIFRRNYCNSRNASDLPGGGGGTTTTGDDCFIAYPGSDNIYENNIAEGDHLKSFALEAVSPGAARNKFYGNMAIQTQRGLQLDARTGTGAILMPTDTDVRDHVVVNPTIVGASLRGNKRTTLKNVSVLGAGTGSVVGIQADFSPQSPGDGVYEIHLENILVNDLGGTGYNIISQDVWSGTNVDSLSNRTAYSPSSSANWISKFTTDPQMGTCKVWRPDGSNAKTNNWGTDILYRYENGVLTKVPLWDPTTGEFPHGVLVAGVNDVAGQSLFDVHERLNVNSNGCPFPAHFRKSGSDATAPAAPMDLQAS